MFFPNLMNIKNSDEVLEIGPGAYPYWRSDCLVDKFDESSDVDLTQFGGLELQTKGKPLFKIIDNKLPFKDQSFDYIICSHVFEHVTINELPLLSEEIMRVAKKAYIEFPRPLYDYIYNLNVHLNLLDIINGEIFCISKEQTHLSKFKKIQDYSLLLRKKGIFSIDEYYTSIMAVGFEFKNHIPIKIVEDENVFWDLVSNNNYYINPPNFFWWLKKKFASNRIKRRIFSEKSLEYFKGKLL